MLNIFSNTKRVDTLENEHQDLITTAKTSGKNFGLRNLPKPDEKLDLYISPITAGYKKLLSLHVKHTTSNEKGNQEKEIATLEKRKVKIEEELPRERDKLVRLNIESGGNYGFIDSKVPVWVQAVCFCIAILEAILTHRAFGLLERQSNVLQFISFCIFCLVFLMLPVAIISLYRTTKESAYRYVIWLGAALIIISGISVLAYFRSLYIANIDVTTFEEANKRTVIIISPVLLVLLQIFLLFISVFACSLLPSKEEKSETQRRKKLCDEINASEKKIAELEEELENIPTRILRCHEAFANGENLARQTNLHIQAMYEEAIGIFITTNLQSRTDREQPSCFEDSVPSLEAPLSAIPNVVPLLTIGILICVAVTSCGNIENASRQKQKSVSLIRDITDTGMIYTKPNQIIQLFDISKDNLYEGYVYRQRIISEAQDQPIYQVEVKPTSWLLSDEQGRIDELKNFKTKVKELIEETGTEPPKSKSHSLVYESLCNELNSLSHNSSSVVIVESDLNQNSSYSLYNPKDYYEAQNNPKAAAEHLLKIAPLRNLNGVKVYLVFRARDYETQKKYDVASRVFKILLEEKNAEVIITPNIIGNE